jgi:alanyl-tRNA synthetase
VNDAIARDLRVHYEEMTVDEAKARGAIGLFEDRYGDKIKVYVGPDGAPTAPESEPAGAPPRT